MANQADERKHAVNPVLRELQKRFRLDLKVAVAKFSLLEMLSLRGLNININVLKVVV